MMKALKAFVMDGKIPTSHRFRNTVWVVGVVLLLLLTLLDPSWRSEVFGLLVTS